MRIMEDREEIKLTQDLFRRSLEKHQPQIVPTTIGYQSGAVERDVQWVPSLGIWAHFGEPPEGKSKGRRYWNVFGLGKPAGMVSIVCEINLPLEGIRRVVAGGFARDQKGGRWVVHRGRFTIAGGMTKEFFRAHYPDEYVLVKDGERNSEVIVVGQLGSDDFGETLRNFVLEIDRIKQIGRRRNR